MKRLPDYIGLYFIIDGNFTREFVKLTRAAVNAGIKMIQYRDKKGVPSEMLQNAVNMRKLTEKSDTIFIVNDSVEVAIRSQADGVHIGQQDAKYEDVRKLLPDKIIGVSAKNLEQARLAERQGAEYVGVGPIFPTTTKRDAGPVLGIRKLAEIVRDISTPVVAIGGINLENVKQVLDTGVSGVAVISAILTKKDPESALRKFLQKTGQV
jgi:thiamine-phosphate diphosphorylase